jgi:hypothetical protein
MGNAVWAVMCINTSEYPEQVWIIWIAIDDEIVSTTTQSGTWMLGGSQLQICIWGLEVNASIIKFLNIGVHFKLLFPRFRSETIKSAY